MTRPTVEVKLEYQNMGYAKTIIKKSYLDENQNNIIVTAGSDKIIADSAGNTLAPFNSTNLNTNNTATNPTSNINCDKYSEDWYKRNDILNQKITYNKTASNGTITTETRLTRFI